MLYEDLLKEAQSYQHPNGRKKRSDAGKKHNYNTQRAKETKPRAQRTDKGKERPKSQLSKTKQAVYAAVKAKLFKKDQELRDAGELPMLRGVDENAYYIVIPASFETKVQTHTQIHNGRAINHTVRRVCTQKELDLERHRFNAWQELALSPDWNKPSAYLPEIRQMLSTRYNIVGKEADEAISKRQITNLELFCEFYHIAESEVSMWDYDTWQSMYELCPCQLLDDDFVFSLTLRPGTPEFHPEFAYHADEVLNNQKQQAKEELERKRRQFSEHWHTNN